MFSVFAFFVPFPVRAGSLDTPGTSGSNMPTITQIYNRLDTGAAIPPPNAAQFNAPSTRPATALADSVGGLGKA
jgi:hypothetical protein